MHYRITRGGQNYGPYTLADLQRYVASGHVLLSDLAKGDEMPDWVTVAQILNPSEVPPAYAPPEAQPGPPAGFYPGEPVAYDAPQQGYMPAGQYPDPPNLNWGLVLLLNILTCTLFQIVWNFVIAAWMKRVHRPSQALIYYGVGYAVGFVASGLSFPLAISALHNPAMAASHHGLSLLSLTGLIIRIVGHFNMKSSLEEHFNTVEPIGLRINGVLLFFFGGLYLQSQLNRVNEIKQAMRYREFGR